MKIALISCVKTKAAKPCQAKDMYISPLFKYAYRYAKQHADKVLILSAKYGLLQETDVISPYEKTLNNMSKRERKIWTIKVLSQLASQADIDNDHFLILAGGGYRTYLCQKLKHYTVPLANVSFGNQLKFYKSCTQ